MYTQKRRNVPIDDNLTFPSSHELEVLANLSVQTFVRTTYFPDRSSKNLKDSVAFQETSIMRPKSKISEYRLEEKGLAIEEFRKGLENAGPRQQKK